MKINYNLFSLSLTLSDLYKILYKEEIESSILQDMLLIWIQFHSLLCGLILGGSETYHFTYDIQILSAIEYTCYYNIGC